MRLASRFCAFVGLTWVAHGCPVCPLEQCLTPHPTAAHAMYWDLLWAEKPISLHSTMRRTFTQSQCWWTTLVTRTVSMPGRGQCTQGGGFHTR
mmetsp:Transcript_66858/g.112078  ORF Transcript_66858/g.112078 Transcript_66858/m.112078 type:complete len:93 (-) Transcript_66858:86-364(-)